MDETTLNHQDEMKSDENVVKNLQHKANLLVARTPLIKK